MASNNQQSTVTAGWWHMDAKLQENVRQVNVSHKHACTQDTFLCTIYLHRDVYSQHEQGRSRGYNMKKKKEKGRGAGRFIYITCLGGSVSPWGNDIPILDEYAADK